MRLPDGGEVAAGERRGYVALREFIEDAAFPCLGGKAALHANALRFGSYSELGSAEATIALAADLRTFVDDDSLHGDFTSFAATFAPRAYDEVGFERALWRQLQQLTDVDERASAWDPSVSDDAADARFSFSFAGRAMFIVGMHANASRIARRFTLPTLVFNPHRQFELLREHGKWERFTQAIRDRDIALQGSTNPNLTDHGEASEARQYSGRAVEANWQCPFHR